MKAPPVFVQKKKNFVLKSFFSQARVELGTTGLRATTLKGLSWWTPSWMS